MKYLKWQDTTIASIDDENLVRFSLPDLNEVVSIYTAGGPIWSGERYLRFLSDRLVCRSRRDIEGILYRSGLIEYDLVKISNVTRAIHPMDRLWIAHSEDERMEEVVPSFFRSVFVDKVDMEGQAIFSPEGCNVKRYGVYQGRYGIYKKPISPLHTDGESEVGAYLLAKRLGVPCCPAFRTDKDWIFSAFLYDVSQEYLVHFRWLSEESGLDLLSVRPRLRDEVTKMVLFDFITRQDDRHLSNMALKIASGGESFYPLYDNGRSLFYGDTQETAERALAIDGASFGSVGSYRDSVEGILKDLGRDGVARLIDLSVTKSEIAHILQTAGFSGYRFDGALEWITKTIALLK